MTYFKMLVNLCLCVSAITRGTWEGANVRYKHKISQSGCLVYTGPSYMLTHAYTPYKHILYVA